MKSYVGTDWYLNNSKSPTEKFLNGVIWLVNVGDLKKVDCHLCIVFSLCLFGFFRPERTFGDQCVLQFSITPGLCGG